MVSIGPSLIVISVFITSATRLPDTKILGIMTRNPPIIKNAITICVAYWMNAMIVPVNISPWIASYAPKYKMRTIIRFKSKVIAGNNTKSILNTFKFTVLKSSFVSLNLSSSYSCLTNALITGIPINISLDIWLILSVSSCITLK